MTETRYVIQRESRTTDLKEWWQAGECRFWDSLTVDTCAALDEGEAEKVMERLMELDDTWAEFYDYSVEPVNYTFEITLKK